jgi:hypothetical protein
MKKINLLYIVPLMLLVACEPDIDEFTPSKGNADFARYVAVGDSWTAGFADASLYLSGQQNSYPNIIAGQLSFVGGGTFNQPLMLDDYGIGLGTGSPMPKMVMGYITDCKGVISLAPVYADVEVNMANLASIYAGVPFNNISTPGMKSFYMGIPGMATLNPYYGRFASGPANTVNSEIPLVDATFFTLWIGTYDILGYAIGGGNDPANPITPTTTFTGSIMTTLDSLVANGAKGVIANIPDVTDLAFFHTIPYNLLTLDQASADALNAGYAILNQIIKGAGSPDTIHFTAGQNPVVIFDAGLPWGIRQIKSDELILLSIPQDSIKCGGWGSQDPIPARYILDATEIGNIRLATDEYNGVITGLATEQGIGLVDIYSVMKNLNAGLVFDNVNFSTKFVTGTFYSTDGLNPTPAGSAVIAYYFIDAINKTFGANTPQVIVGNYPGVKLP